MFKDIAIKNWIIIFGLVAAIVIILGLVFQISFQQMIGIILITVILVVSALFFRFIGEKKNSNN
ncbi:MAG: hypothetical protein AB7V56_11350 [Candidatus Nitrosocosmicus sp.]|jgi:ABC-type transport system involved in cytochrome bd biosynthesis fused ATPase/permease subunit